MMKNKNMGSTGKRIKSSSISYMSKICKITKLRALLNYDFRDR
jgi:hypothetical protein